MVGYGRVEEGRVELGRVGLKVRRAMQSPKGEKRNACNSRRRKLRFIF